MKNIILLLLLTLTFNTHGDPGEALGRLPVQDGGRIKPFDTFARETLQLVYGRQSYKGQNGKRSATEIVMTWMLIPQEWDDIPLVEVRHSGLREALNLKGKKSRFKAKELMSNPRVGLIIQELQSKRKLQEKLNPYFQAVQRLESQLTMYNALKVGLGLRVAPPAEGDTWQNVADLKGSLAEAFSQISSSFVKAIEVKSTQLDSKAAELRLEQAVAAFIDEASRTQPAAYANMNKIKVELHLNKFHPFMWAWILYLIAALFLIFGRLKEAAWTTPVVWISLIGAFLLHTYGMTLRVYITGRPPVSNMYETVIWVPWGAVVFAAVLERIYKNKMALIGASLISVLCLILSDLSPTVLDPTLQPLEPVLRSTFWLTTHVLIITLSYAAFFLAFVLGDIMLFYFLKGEENYKRKIAADAQLLYRSIQIGVVLLAAGTILGGVWADYSWGRFWGWDPKETWAFIALMGYIALLHARLAGWVRQFGLAVGAIVAFSLVIMAWYGVNFVLGAGLHSYGFGAGGVEYVSAFVAVHLLWVTYVATVRRSQLAEKTGD